MQVMCDDGLFMRRYGKPSSSLGTSVDEIKTGFFNALHFETIPILTFTLSPRNVQGSVGRSSREVSRPDSGATSQVPIRGCKLL